MKIFKRIKCEHDWHPKNGAIDVCHKCKKEKVCEIWKDSTWKKCDTWYSKIRWFYYVKVKYRE